MNALEPLSFSALPAAGAAQAGGTADAVEKFLDAPRLSQPSISTLGRALSKAASGTAAGTSPYQDIEDSDLPDTVKHLLRMIRDLRERLAELTRELQAVQADETLSPDTKRTRMLQIRAQMSALNGALMTATRKLASLMREMQLDQAQQMSAAQLAL